MMPVLTTSMQVSFAPPEFVKKEGERKTLHEQNHHSNDPNGVHGLDELQIKWAQKLKVLEMKWTGKL